MYVTGGQIVPLHHPDMYVTGRQIDNRIISGFSHKSPSHHVYSCNLIIFSCLPQWESKIAEIYPNFSVVHVHGHPIAVQKKLEYCKTGALL